MYSKGLHYPIVTHKAYKLTRPTYKAQLERSGPRENLEELSLSVEDHLKTHKYFVSDSTVPRISRVSLFRPRSFFLLCQAYPLTQA